MQPAGIEGMDGWGRISQERSREWPFETATMAQIMLTSIKIAGKRLFSVVGLEIHKKKKTSTRASMSGALRQLARLGFQPRTVIDVGVADQTSELYEAFPAANILLIEPLEEFEPFLKTICKSYKAEYVLAAAGEAPGAAVLHVSRDKFGSSLLKGAAGSPGEHMPRQVPVVTIDQVCADRNLSGPLLIKVDVQGAELSVLAGAQLTLKKTEAVILEVSLFEMMSGAPQFYDVISWMNQEGFVAYDISGFLYRPLDNALAQIDMVFVSREGQFRKSHGFATAEQSQIIAHEMERKLVALFKKHE